MPWRGYLVKIDNVYPYCCWQGQIGKERRRRRIKTEREREREIDASKIKRVNKESSWESVHNMILHCLFKDIVVTDIEMQCLIVWFV